MHGPRKTPHPDYPTAKRAKTSKLFVFEEPDRGPLLLTVAIPAHDKLTYHEHCELDHDRVICSRAARKPKAADQLVWQVAWAKGKVVWVARRVGARVASRVVFVYKGEGKARRLSAIAHLDGYGIVRWSRHFDAEAKSYTSRKRSGANKLEGCGKTALSHDKLGRVSAASCLQWSGAPMLDEDGVHRRAYRRDKRGFIIDTARYGIDGKKPAASHDGVHRVTRRLDAAGRETGRVYRDSSGLATLSAKTGCSGFMYEHDRRGFYVARTCLDGQGSRTGGRDGLARTSYSYDARGCLVAEQRLYDTPSSSFRRHLTEYFNNERCQPTRMVCYDKQRKRAGCGPGEPAEKQIHYDAQGNKTSEQHFDARGRPGRDAYYNVFEVRGSHDARGNRTRMSCFAPRSLAVPCGRTGFHEARSTYDDAGRLVSQRFFDTRGYRASNLRTYERRYRYDNYDHLAATENLGINGKLTSSLGEAKRRYIYDAGHRMFGLLLYDRWGNPARYRGCIVGKTCPNRSWHAMRVVRRLDGSVANNLFFDHDGQLIHTVDCGKQRCWR